MNDLNSYLIKVSVFVVVGIALAMWMSSVAPDAILGSIQK